MSDLEKKFRERYFMPEEGKKPLVEKNLKLLRIIIPLLLIVDILGLVYTFINDRTNVYEYIYFGGMIFFIIQNYSFVLMASKNKKWSTHTKNQAVYMLFTACMAFTVYGLFIRETKIDSFITLCVIVVLAFDFFYIEFRSYIIMFSIFSAVTLGYCFFNQMYSTAVVFFLFYLVLAVFCEYNSRTIVIKYKQHKELEERTLQLEKEINLAGNVQENFLKKDFSEIKDYEIEVYSKALAGVSGDFYDFYTKHNELKGFGLFDISGHGISSGLLTLLVRNIIHQEFEANSDKELYEMMDIIDKRIRLEKGTVENYLTGILVRVSGNKLQIVNAGHINPIIYKKYEDKVSFVDNERKHRSTVIGLNSIDSFFDVIEVDFESGDEIILYTDGITEMQNSAKRQYGKNRLLNSAENFVRLNIKKQIPMLLESVQEYSENKPWTDDATVVIIRKR